MSKFSIYLVRHGQTYFNLYNRMQGWSDSPLTDAGQVMATKVGEALADVHFSHYYASDSQRAVNTAKLIQAASNHADEPLTPLANFREVFYGYFEGDDCSRVWSLVGKQYNVTSLHELLAYVDIAQTRNMMQRIDPLREAEDNATYWQRVSAGFDYLRAHHDHHENILLVSHGTTIRSIVAQLDPDIDITIGPKNGSLTRLDVDDDQIKVVSYAQDII